MNTNKPFNQRRKRLRKYFLSIVGAALLSGLLAFSTSSPTFFGAASAFLIVLSLAMLGPFIGTLLEASSEKKAEDALANCRYKYYNRKTAIGVDADARILHLIEGKIHKSYPFSDVRQWERKALTGGAVYGGSLATNVNANMNNAIENRKGSGLFVSVRDIDYPYWHIMFEPEDFKKELPRWMEILERHINENPS